MSESLDADNKLVIAEATDSQGEKNEPSTSGMSGDKPSRRVGRRPGRRSSKMDVRAKLERSRQSARECRARKKLRYQYLEDLVANREKAVFALREELELYKQWCIQIDKGLLPLALLKLAKESEDGSNDEEPSDTPEGAVGGLSSTEEDTVADIVEILESSDDETEVVKTDSVSGIKGSEFKVPELLSKPVVSQSLASTSDSEAGATGFLSDLCSYSTIGINSLSAKGNTHGLSTIIEKGTHDSNDAAVKNSLPLLPTFITDFKDE